MRIGDVICSVDIGINLGVLQGYNLGPISFILVINDVTTVFQLNVNVFNKRSTNNNNFCY